ncbi:MAG: acyltransferase [Muribaculaceae bacterium]|nr:acyltransferase [Muribaculaceae bacterium]
MRYIFLILYYCFAAYLPDSYSPLVGGVSNKIRIFCCRRIFKRCGRVSNINRCAYFGKGTNIEMGDFSSIGAHCKLPNDLIIGDYVMMAPDVLIFNRNHKFSDPSRPFCQQGMTEDQQVVIGDNVWIGERAIITAGRRIARDTVIAAGTVVTKDFPEASVIGGNPAKLIKGTFD